MNAQRALLWTEGKIRFWRFLVDFCVGPKSGKEGLMRVLLSRRGMKLNASIELSLLFQTLNHHFTGNKQRHSVISMCIPGSEAH